MGGYTGYQSLGQAVFLGIGAYVMAGANRNFGINPFLMIIPAGAVSFVFAIGLGWVCLRLKGLFFAIATTLVAVIASNIVAILPVSFIGGGEGIYIPLTPWKPYLNETIFYEVMFACFVITNIVVYKIVRTKFGLGLSSIKGDELGAESMGVPTTRLKIIAFASSAFFYGMAGAVFGYWQFYVFNLTVFNPLYSLTPMLGSYIGGVGTIIGPILGNLILVTLTETLRFTFAKFTTLWFVVYGIVLVSVITFMPQGLIGFIKSRFERVGKRLV